MKNRYTPYLEKNGLFKKRIDANQWISKFKEIFAELLFDDDIHPVNDVYSNGKYRLANDLSRLIGLLDKLHEVNFLDKMTLLQSLNYRCHKIKNDYQFAKDDYINTIIQEYLPLLNEQITDILEEEERKSMNCLSC